MSKVKVKESGANPNITSWFNLRPATIHLGVLYKRLGKLNEARACFREHVKLGIDMLIDDDDSNDFGAYSALGTVFAAADEDIQASAAFQYLVFDRAGDDDDRSPDEGNEEQLETHDKDGTAKAVTTLPIRAAETPGEKVKDEDDNDSASANGHQDDDTRSESGSTEAESALGGGVRGDSDSDDSEFESPFSCDGCDKSIEDALYVCRYCADTAFCPDCFKLRESDTGFSFNVCHIKHPMLFVKQPTIPYKADQVLVGEKVMMLNEWIEQLKGEWQL